MAIATTRTAAQTASNTFGAFLPNYWDAVLGENLYPNLTFYAFGTKRQIPRNFGLTIKIPRFKKNSGVVAQFNAASEGNAILGAITTTRATSEFVSGTLKQFIGVYRHSDLVVMTALSDVVNLSLKDIARDLALQMDTHVRDQISGTGSSIQAGGVAASAHSSDIIKASSFLKAAALLDGNNNPRPQGGAYPAVIHPFQQADLQGQITGNAWLEINKYKGSDEPEMLYRGELGRLFGCALTTSTNVNRTLGGARFNISTGASGYQDYVFAPEAYYVTEINDMTAKTYVKQLGSAGAFDPVNTVATVGAKVFFTAIPTTWQASPGNSASTEIRMIRIQAGGRTPS